MYVYMIHAFIYNLHYSVYCKIHSIQWLCMTSCGLFTGRQCFRCCEPVVVLAPSVGPTSYTTRQGSTGEAAGNA